jgi:hypothetical protein
VVLNGTADEYDQEINKLPTKPARQRWPAGAGGLVACSASGRAPNRIDKADGLTRCDSLGADSPKATTATAMTSEIEDSALQLPPPGRVQAALRMVTERLALELAAPTASPPYLWFRLAPSAELRERRRMALQTEPSMTGSDWGAISHRRRGMRVRTGPPAHPRPPYNVRAALALRR